MTGEAPASYRSFFYPSFDGLRLAARVYDAPGSALPLVCLAGLSRTSRDFHELALHVSADPRRARRVIAFDYRGRGASQFDPNPKNYMPLIELRDMFDGMTALGLTRAVFVGTSRGGIAAMLAAAIRPDALAATVLDDVGPEIEPAGLDEIRRYVGKTPDPLDWPAAVAALKHLHSQRFTGLSDDDWQAWARTTFADRSGRPAVDYDPALVVTLEPPPPPPPDAPPLPADLWPQFHALAANPVLVLRGENSPLLSAATAAAMAASHASVTLETVPGQGHPVQLRGTVNERVAAFLAALPE